LHTNVVIVKDTGQYIIVEGCEVFQGVHHRNDKVVVPLDLRKHLIYNRKEEGISYHGLNRIYIIRDLILVLYRKYYVCHLYGTCASTLQYPL